MSVTSLYACAKQLSAFVFLSTLFLFPIKSHGQWTSQTSGTTEDLFGVYFMNSSTGWACGRAGTIISSGDGGQSWGAVPSGVGMTISMVNLPDGVSGCFVGTNQNDQVRVTGNSGTNWNMPAGGDPPNFGALHDLHMVTTSVGWAVGAAGAVMKTTDGGNIWATQADGLTAVRLRAVFFTDSQTGWAAGEGGKILSTISGGTMWSATTAGGNVFYDLNFIDANTGWAVGENGTIFKTTNGGGTWSPQSSGVSSRLRGVHFVDANTGWIVGEGGIVLKTTNGGTNWGQQASGVTNNLYNVWAFDVNTAVAVGGSGKVIRTDNGGGAILPVTLSFFGAKNTGEGTVALNWETASETDHHGFSVQWRTGAGAWEDIAFLPGSGSPSESRAYFHVHEKPADGMNYYRLKMTGHDGSFEFSPVRSVEMEMLFGQIKIYPNPADEGYLMLGGFSKNSPDIKFEIWGLDGKPELRGDIFMENGEAQKIELPQLPAGLYFIKIWNGKAVSEKSFWVK